MRPEQAIDELYRLEADTAVVKPGTPRAKAVRQGIEAVESILALQRILKSWPRKLPGQL